MRLIIVLLALGAAVTGFASNLAKEDVAGRRLSLVDEKKIEEYQLARSGVVLAEFGAKGGPTTAPVFRWRIEAGRLVVFDSDRVVDSLQLIEKKDSGWTFRRRNGDVVVFNVAGVE
jgi:hypothetical protein